jgi:RNA polymerase sporulation-specific sigma factor
MFYKAIFGGYFLLFSLLQIFSNLYFLALHVTGVGSFPPPLSAKREAELLEESRAGNINSRNLLVEHNLRLVAHIVKKYYAASSNQDDLISIGTIGLIKAVSTFKTDKNIRLATYASRCIENEILMFFRNQKKSAQDVYISDPIDTDKQGNTLTLIDVIADKTDIVETLDTQIKLDKLKSIITKTLDKRELEIINLRYGLGGFPELTQREIAKKLNISRSYVSRIEKSALEKLRAQF